MENLIKRLRHQLSWLRWAGRLSALPRRVAWFQWRARRVASRNGDAFSLTSATRPADLEVLLDVAKGHQRIVELGTATAWTAISLVLADPARSVLSYDVLEREERRAYLALVNDETRSRIKLMIAPGSSGSPDGRSVDLLYIDSSHSRDDTLAEVQAWRPVLRSGALIVFDDFTHPDFPGVREAVAELALEGEQRGTLFIHQVA